jgi:hypothetical protein
VSFLPGKGLRVLANERDVSGSIAGASATHQRAVSDVTVVTTDGGMNFVPGLMSGAIALRGPSDSDSALQSEVQAAIGVDNTLLVTVCPDGYTAVGKPAMFTLGDPSDYTMDAQVADALGYVVTSTADESVDMGWIVHALAAETADGNGTAVDRGAAPATPTTNGAMAAIHVTAFSGLTSAAIKIQHSTDNSVWADLVSFAAVTAVGAERKLVAKGTTVNRYVRAVTDVTGTGSVTFLVALAPR